MSPKRALDQHLTGYLPLDTQEYRPKIVSATLHARSLIERREPRELPLVGDLENEPPVHITSMPAHLPTWTCR